MTTMIAILSALTTEQALYLYDEHADSWDAVQWSRDASATARDLAIPFSVHDREGRSIVDALPSSFVVSCSFQVAA